MQPIVSAPLLDPVPSVAARVFTSGAGLVKPREVAHRSTENRTAEWTAYREEREYSMPLPGARRSGSVGASVLRISGRCLAPAGGGRVVLQEVVSSAQGGSAHNNTILVLERVVIPAPLHYSEGPASERAEKFVEVSYSREEGLPGESSSPFLGSIPAAHQKQIRYSHVTILPEGITIPIH